MVTNNELSDKTMTENKTKQGIIMTLIIVLNVINVNLKMKIHFHTGLIPL